MGARSSTAQPEIFSGASGPASPARPESAIAFNTCWSQSSITTRAAFAATLAAALLAARIPDVATSSAVTLAVLVPAALVDIRTRRLPDVWVGAAAVVFLLADASARAFGAGSPASPGAIVAGAAVLALPLLGLHLVSPAAMGFGDVKLAVVAGAALGATDWQLALPALALAAGGTATYGLVRRARHVAFGPGLVGAAIVALHVHELLVRPR